MPRTPAAAAPSRSEAPGVSAPRSTEPAGGSSSAGGPSRASQAPRASIGPRASTAPATNPIASAPQTLDHPRRATVYMYYHAPYAVLHLSWMMPWFYRRHRRVQRVLINSANGFVEKQALLWSSNITSDTISDIPFFPGLVSDPVRATAPSAQIDLTAYADDRTQRYSDGHLGPGDPCEHAQYYRSGAPYLAFVRRSRTPTTQHLASYRTLFEGGASVYEPRSGAYRASASFVQDLREENSSYEADIVRLRPSTVTWIDFYSARPLFPSPSDISRLSDVMSPDAYIDHATRVQRGLRLKLAYATMAKLVAEDHGRPPVKDLRSRGQPDANMEFLGVWINTAPEWEGLWLLIRGRVPVYVASIVAGSNSADTKALTDLVSGLPERTVPRAIADAAAPLRSDTIPPRPEVPEYSTPDLAPPHVQGWMEQPALAHHVLDHPDYPFGWVQSPPVPRARTSSNRDNFILSSDWKGDPCFIHMSDARAQSHSVANYIFLYDLENRRRYYLRVYPQVHGLVEPEIFGYPIPRLPHYVCAHTNSTDRGDYKLVPAGRWGYKTANPGDQYVGRVPLRPALGAPVHTVNPRLLDEETISLGDEDCDDDTFAEDYAMFMGGRPPTAAAAPNQAGSSSATLVSGALASDSTFVAGVAAPARRPPSPIPMEVDTPSAARAAPGAAPAPSSVELGDAMRAFVAWQMAFPEGSWRREHHPRPSRLAPADRGRFAYHARISLGRNSSWSTFLTAFTQDERLRGIEVDHVFRASVNDSTAIGVIVPAAVLREQLVSMINRYGLNGQVAHAETLSPAQYSSLAAQADANSYWSRPPTEYPRWRSERRQRSPYSHASSSRRPSPSRRSRRSSPPRSARYPAPSPPLTLAASTLACPAPPLTVPTPPLPVSSPPLALFAPLYAVTTSALGVPTKPLSVPSLAVTFATSPLPLTLARATLTADHAARYMGRAKVASASFSATLGLPNARRLGMGIGRTRRLGWKLIMRAALAPAPAEGTARSDLVSPALPALPLASVVPSPVVASSSGAGSAMDAFPGWPLPGLPSILQYAAYLTYRSSFPGLDPLVLAQIALTGPVPASLSAPSPLGGDASVGALAGHAVDAAMALQPPGAGPSSVPAVSPPSLLSRLAPPSLLDRLTDPPPPAPSLGDRLSDPTGDEEQENRRRNHRGGRRVRERVGKGKARDKEYDPRYPGGFSRRPPSPGAGGTGASAV
ncbi:hypothetical protein GGG16DRAFT_119360 [Schizophyllum commune]